MVQGIRDGVAAIFFCRIRRGKFVTEFEGGQVGLKSEVLQVGWSWHTQDGPECFILDPLQLGCLCIAQVGSPCWGGIFQFTSYVCCVYGPQVCLTWAIYRVCKGSKLKVSEVAGLLEMGDMSLHGQSGVHPDS